MSAHFKKAHTPEKHPGRANVCTRVGGTSSSDPQGVCGKIKIKGILIVSFAFSVWDRSQRQTWHGLLSLDLPHPHLDQDDIVFIYSFRGAGTRKIKSSAFPVLDAASSCDCCSTCPFHKRGHWDVRNRHQAHWPSGRHPSPANG